MLYCINGYINKGDLTLALFYDQTDIINPISAFLFIVMLIS